MQHGNVNSGATKPSLSEHSLSIYALAIGALFAVLYYLTMYTSVGPGDSGEVMTAAYNFSVAHPPGFPLYILIGWLWSNIVVIGEVAWRLNLLSVVCGASVCAFSFIAIVHLLRKFRLDQKTAIHAALVSALVLGAGNTLWHWSRVAEVYSLNSLLIAALLAFILSRKSFSRRELVIAGVLFGLGLAVHYSSTLFIVPMLLAWLWSELRPLRAKAPAKAKAKKKRSAVQAVSGPRWSGRLLRSSAIGIGAALATSLVLYAMLIPASGSERMPNWGNPADVQRLVWHVSAKQFSVNLGLDSADQIGERVGPGLLLWWKEFTPLGFLVGLFGWGVLAYRRSPWAWGIAGTVFLTFLYNTLYYIDVQDRESYHLPLYICSALAIAFGLAELFRRIPAKLVADNRRYPEYLLGIVPAVAFVIIQFSGADHSGHTYHRDFVRNTLEALPDNALVLTEEFELYSPYMYQRSVEGRWAEPVVIDLLLWKDRPWYVENIKHRFPELTAQWQPALDKFLQELYVFERGDLNDTRNIAAYYKQVLENMESSPGRNVYLDTRAIGHFNTYGARRSGRDIPEGLLFRSHKGELPRALPALDWNTEALLNRKLVPEPTEELLIRQYVYMLQNRLRYLGQGTDSADERATAELLREIRMIHRDIDF